MRHSAWASRAGCPPPPPFPLQQSLSASHVFHIRFNGFYVSIEWAVASQAESMAVHHVAACRLNGDLIFGLETPPCPGNNCRMRAEKNQRGVSRQRPQHAVRKRRFSFAIASLCILVWCHLICCVRQRIITIITFVQYNGAHTREKELMDKGSVIHYRLNRGIWGRTLSIHFLGSSLQCAHTLAIAVRRSFELRCIWRQMRMLNGRLRLRSPSFILRYMWTGLQ